jgi:hypothetical protein
MTLDTLKLAERWEAAGLPPRQARDRVTALAEEIREELATKKLVRAELANLRYQMLASSGIETRGVSGHGFIDSVDFRDPDGDVVELTTKTAEEHKLLDPDRARRTLDEWREAKA